MTGHRGVAGTDPGAGLGAGADARAPSAALAALDRALGAASPAALRWSVREAGDDGANVERLRVLAPAADRAAVVAHLRGSGFRPVAPAPRYRLPGADDWFGVDPADATLLHVCLQGRLTLGAAVGKRLTIGGVDDASIAEIAGAPREASRMALALGACERALRGGAAGPPEAASGPPGEPLRRDAPSRAAFAALFGPEPAARLLDAALDGDGASLRAGLRRVASARPAEPNRTGPRRPALARRERAGPAPLIVVIGSDGSGKSTVARWLAGTLDAAFGARFLYFGTGDGPGSFVRIALNAARRRSRFGAAPRSREGGDDGASPPAAAARPPTALKLVWAAVVGAERVAKMRALERARRAGLTVVTDRFPQNERGGIHDGPRLHGLIETGAGGPARAFARLERAVYARLARHVPDRVLLLDVPLELARRRRPEEPEAELARRIAVARALRYADAPRTVLDASAPLEAVKAQALRAALEVLARASGPRT